jgi:hypothetical protein
MKRIFKVSHDLPLIVREFKTISPSRIARIISNANNRTITRQAISVWFKRHPDTFTKLKEEIRMKPRNQKHLLLDLSAGEYSAFWYVGDLLGLSKKKDIFLGMMEFVKKFKERNE